MHLRYAPLILSLAFSPLTPALAQADLPTFRQHYSEPQEMLYQAQQHIAYLRKSGQLIEDSFASQYLYDLGNYLASFSKLSAYTFKFYIVKDPSINAYAMPGGNIVIHTGLIKATRNLDELVAVIAHEMAHIQRAHLLRREEKMADDTLPILAGTLASIALMSVNPQAAMAGITSIQALQAQNAIDITRGYEWEADEMGIDIMYAAGYRPQAMASFFEQLGQNDQQIPELLLTHPVTQKRISTAQATASRLPDKHTQQAQEDALGYPYLKSLVEGTQPQHPSAQWLKLHAPWHLYRQEQLTQQAQTETEKRKALNFLTQALDHSAYPAQTYRLMAKLHFELKDAASSHWALAMAAAQEADYRLALAQIAIAKNASSGTQATENYEKLEKSWQEELKKHAAAK